MKTVVIKFILLSIIGAIILAGFVVLISFEPPRQQGGGVPSIIIGLVVALIFGAFAIFLSLIELVVLRRLGLDITANLSIKGEYGKSELQFQAVGVIAFLVFQPLMLFYLALKIGELL